MHDLEMMPVRYYLNIGSNTGEREKYLEAALAGLRRRYGSVLVSDTVESAPWGFESDRPFLNVGAAIEYAGDPVDLMHGLQALEKEISTVPHRNADGTYRDRDLDIDIMDREGAEVHEAGLDIPHRHLEEREFFLSPLRQLRDMKVFVFDRDRILLKSAEGAACLPTAAEAAGAGMAGETFRLGPCAAFRCRRHEGLPSGYEWAGWREAWPKLGEELWNTGAKGLELVNWDGLSAYCGRCGAKMERSSEISKKCSNPACGGEVFPPLAPAVVVLVIKGEEALLVHAANFKGRMHALVAGFVETGETLEETVRREVKEETSLEVSDIRYFGSQSWPFPGQLMIAFTARWTSGQPTWSDGELTSGGFFSRSALPELPGAPSLSRRLIDAWIEGRL